jgi:uncharacterized glyoxalase superfamily protein PhnB
MKWDFVGITSANLEESVRFYRLLGCPFSDPNGQDHIEAHFDNGMRLALDSVELMKQLGHWEEPKGQRIGLGFNVETPDKVDATYRAIIQAGFEGATEPWDAFWGQRYAQVIDPDGNKVDIFANL